MMTTTIANAPTKDVILALQDELAAKRAELEELEEATKGPAARIAELEAAIPPPPVEDAFRREALLVNIALKKAKPEALEALDEEIAEATAVWDDELMRIRTQIVPLTATARAIKKRVEAVRGEIADMERRHREALVPFLTELALEKDRERIRHHRRGFLLGNEVAALGDILKSRFQVSTTIGLGVDTICIPPLTEASVPDPCPGILGKPDSLFGLRTGEERSRLITEAEGHVLEELEKQGLRLPGYSLHVISSASCSDVGPAARKVAEPSSEAPRLNPGEEGPARKASRGGLPEKIRASIVRPEDEVFWKKKAITDADAEE